MIKERFIGCGYCQKESTCSMRDPKINKAKLGCKDYTPIESLPKLDIPLTFRGVDSFNRPVFKQDGHRVYFGSTQTLFTPDDYPEVITEYFRTHMDELEYFGSQFNCEPHGGLPPRYNLILKEQ
jgi:hypothetical protein